VHLVHYLCGGGTCLPQSTYLVSYVTALGPTPNEHANKVARERCGGRNTRYVNDQVLLGALDCIKSALEGRIDCLEPLASI